MRDAELQQKRLVAAAIDIGILIGVAIVMGIVTVIAGFISGWLSLIMSVMGMLVSCGFMLARDILGGDRSLGKKLQGIRVLQTNGAPVTIMESAKRNAIFAAGNAVGVLAALLGFIPVVGCLAVPLYALCGIASLAAVVVEFVKISQDPEGIRLGDQYAGTKVVL
jgi:uncharacterized RDD family membrane protein YckC